MIILKKIQTKYDSGVDPIRVKTIKQVAVMHQLHTVEASLGLPLSAIIDLSQEVSAPVDKLLESISNKEGSGVYFLNYLSPKVLFNARFLQ